MILALEILVAALLCGVVTLAGFLTQLYVESLRLRPHPGARAFAVFEEVLQPRLKLEPTEGVRRYTMLKQGALIVLTVASIRIVSSDELSLATAAEALLMTFAALAVFGHILPSVLITRTTGEWARSLVGVARALAWTIAPLVVLTGFAKSVAELGGEETKPEANGSPGDIQVFLDVGEEEGFIGQEDRQLIQSVVEFGDKTVREVMTPRPEIAALPADSTIEQVRQAHIAEEYSRIPIYEGSIDNIIGFVHSRDTLEIDRERRQTTKARELSRPLTFVPETKLIHELMRELQQQNAQMAIVVDEYGQTAGLVTMEDMMEEIVGEIRDESEPDLDVVEYPDRSFVASGNLDLDRLAELVGFRPDEDTESTTLGGLVCEQLGQVPDPGAKVRLDGIEIEVLSADERRVRSLRVRRAQDAEGVPARPQERAS
ncbi:MAG: CBS domain-containing protein [Acidobacteria bacterium]|nr:CBS domain-containing protein [Acidobacteriota bacterium]